MKKTILYSLISIVLLGCEKVLDKRELNAIDADDLWNIESLANLYLNSLYQDVLPGFGGTSNSGISDESIGSGTGNMLYGQLTRDDPFGIFGTNTYNNIREANILIDDIDGGSLDEEIKSVIKGQALFLRAWLYWELVKYYGGVPLILRAQDPFDYESLLVKRSSARECINQIIADLDMAIDMLPPQWPSNERGRITRGAAAALKGRVLLFYASPQFNPSYLAERWEDAYDANKSALEICEEDGYELYNKFEDIFIDESKANEAIFLTLYNDLEKTNGYEDNVRPRSESEAQDEVSNCPNWEFVKSFPMKDGLPVNGHPEYDSNYFWLNRDPRFYATIAYNGCIWELSGKTNRRQWTYSGNTVEPTETNDGASITGFYCRKNVNPDIPKLETPRTPTDWIEIRLAEVYLNLAECAAELNLIDEAKNLLIIMRERAGIEAGDGSYGITAVTKEDMVEAVMLERKIELAFENKRHWDLRRRNMYINDLNNTPKLNGTRRHGLSITLNTEYILTLDPAVGETNDSVYYHFENVIIDTLDINKYYTDFFTTTIIEIDALDINYLQPEYNFYFIPVSDVEKNKNLQQTIYWTDINPFDPLEN